MRHRCWNYKVERGVTWTNPRWYLLGFLWNSMKKYYLSQRETVAVIFFNAIITSFHHKPLLLLTGRTFCIFLHCSGAEEASNWSHSVFFFMFTNLCSILILTVHPRLVPTTEWAFVQFLRVTGSDDAALTDDSKADFTLQNRLVEDMQHFGADTEGPEVPQEVQSVI